MLHCQINCKPGERVYWAYAQQGGQGYWWIYTTESEARGRLKALAEENEVSTVEWELPTWGYIDSHCDRVPDTV